MKWYKWNDPVDRWFGRDKLAHFAGAYSLTLGLLLLRPDLPSFAAGVGVAASVAVEVVEEQNYATWSAHGRPGLSSGFWPWLTDKASPKDLVYDGAGIVCALITWALLGYAA